MKRGWSRAEFLARIAVIAGELLKRAPRDDPHDLAKLGAVCQKVVEAEFEELLPVDNPIVQAVEICVKYPSDAIRILSICEFAWDEYKKRTTV